MRFLAARADEDGRRATVLIQGVPYEGGVSYRAGAAEGPAAVRVASDSIESWSPRARADLEELDVADAGDLDVAGREASTVMERVADATESRARRSALVVTLGGDHSISIGTSRGLRRAHPDLCHLVYDAHLDLRETYEGSEYSHACGTRHMAKAGPTWVLGARSGSRAEFDDADALLRGWSEDLTPTNEMREEIGARAVFVSVDLDVLDPATFPGTGNPEPGGAGYRELREALCALRGLRVVGLDLLEIAPPLDPSGLTPIVAAELLRDLVLVLRGS